MSISFRSESPSRPGSDSSLRKATGLAVAGAGGGGGGGDGGGDGGAAVWAGGNRLDIAFSRTPPLPSSPLPLQRLPPPDAAAAAALSLAAGAGAAEQARSRGCPGALQTSSSCTQPSKLPKP